MTAENEKFVSIYYTLKDDDGNVIDSTTEGDGLGFVMGRQYILPKLEEAIFGKSVGDKLSVVLEAKDGYGEFDENMISEVDREMFDTDMEIEIGMAFQAMTAFGPRIVRVVKVEDKKITVDGNHELAGKRLHFDVEVHEVREATESELNPTCGGGCGGCGGGCGDGGCEGGCGGCGDGGCGCGE